MKTISLILLLGLLIGACSKDDAFLCNENGHHNSPVPPGGRHWKKYAVFKMVENIHWIQQSCFRIDGGFRSKIYIDPLSITKTDVADLILITHAHGDHFSQADIDKITGPNTILIAPADCQYAGKAKRIVLKPGQTYFYRGILIKAVPAYNILKTQYHPIENKWVGYIITMNGVSIYHAGDTERIPEMQDFSCDIALIPLGQTYTMNTIEDAAESVIDVGAMVAIPMHYGFYEGTDEDAIAFKNLLSGSVSVILKEKEAL